LHLLRPSIKASAEMSIKQDSLRASVAFNVLQMRLQKLTIGVEQLTKYPYKEVIPRIVYLMFIIFTYEYLNLLKNFTTFWYIKLSPEFDLGLNDNLIKIS